MYAPAFRNAYSYLTEKGIVPKRIRQNEKSSYWLGFSSKKMWKEFIPNLDPSIRNKACKIIGVDMFYQICRGKATLYEGSLETLACLSIKGYHLVFISDCSMSYRDISRDAFKLDIYFDEMISFFYYCYFCCWILIWLLL